MRFLFSLVAAISSVALSGCNSAEPPYPAAILAYDEGLVGEWKTAPNPKNPHDVPMTLKFESREVPIVDGKLDAGGLNTVGTIKTDGTQRAAAERRKAYRIENFPDSPDKSLKLLGVMFEKGGKRFLGLQVQPKSLSDAGFGGWVIPVHRALAIERDGDTLRILSLAVEIAWIPQVNILDGVKAKSDTLKTLSEEKAGGHVTTDIDRLLDILDEATASPDAWSEPTAGVLQRVKP